MKHGFVGLRVAVQSPHAVTVVEELCDCNGVLQVYIEMQVHLSRPACVRIELGPSILSLDMH